MIKLGDTVQCLDGGWTDGAKLPVLFAQRGKIGVVQGFKTYAGEGQYAGVQCATFGAKDMPCLWPLKLCEKV